VTFENAIHAGDCLEIMRGWPEASVHCVVTSPPYWGLRSYAGEQERVWGGDEGCEHAWGEQKIVARKHYDLGTSTLMGSNADQMGQGPFVGHSAFCLRCGAWRGALGLEPTPELYIEHMVSVFREVRRVLRDDGAVWLNVGDSYNGSGGAGGDYATLKPLDLCMIPARLALALQANGWWLRSVCIWSKDAPMPESMSSWRWEQHRIKIRTGRYDSDEKQAITRTGAELNQRWNGEEGWSAEYQDCPGCPKCSPNDGLVLRRGRWRPTTAHEYVYLLAKSQDYFADGEAVREPISEASIQRIRQATFHSQTGGEKDYGHGVNPNRSVRKALENFAKNNDGGRNLRTVWNIGTQGFPGAHFATFPPKLAARMIQSGCPPKVCAECGAPWARVIQRTGKFQRRWSRENADGSPYDAQGSDQNSYRTVGWRPTCKCGAECEAGIVLDPFLGSGTVAVMAERLQRRWIGIEISEEYRILAEARIAPEREKMILPMEDGALDADAEPEVAQRSLVLGEGA